MIERRHQADMLGQQHAVAEHIARHVAHPHHGKVGGLDVGAQFAEVALDRFPGAARGDAHLLVVIADAAAAGEGIAQPEAAPQRDGIGDVGEGGGALVGRHHQIGIIAVRAQHVRRRHNLAILVQIVGHIQKRVDEGLVGCDACFHELFAGGVGGHQLGKEAALGAHRHDHRILDLLRLDQAQDFGAEILRPVAPAQAAACDASEAQMHPFQRGGIDEDFPPGARRGQFLQPGGIEFHRQGRTVASIGAWLEEIGAQHRVDHILETADDAVIVQRQHVLQRRRDALFDFGHRGGAIGVQAIFRCVRIVPGMEQRHQQRRHIGIAHQGLLHIGQRKGHRRLAQILAHGAQDGDVAPFQARPDHQPVEIVAFGRAGKHGMKSVFDRFADLVELDGQAVGALHGKIQHHRILPPAAVGVEGDGKGILGNHFQAQIFKDRQGRRQGQHVAQNIELEPQRRGGVAVAAPHARAQVHPALGARQLLQHGQIAGPFMGGKGAAIAGGKARIQRGQAGMALAAAMGGAQRVDQVIVPGGDQGGNLALQLAHIDRWQRPVVAADDEVQPHQGAVIHRLVIGRGPSVEGLGQQGVDVAAQPGGDLVARRQQQRGDKAVEAIEAQEQLQARQPAHAQDAGGDHEKFIGRNLEQFVAREGIQDVTQGLAVMAGGGQARMGHHRFDLAAQQRDVARLCRIGAGGEQADKAALAGKGAMGIEGLDADIVHMGAPVHQAAGGALGDDDRLGRIQEGAHFRRQAAALAAAAQHPGVFVGQHAQAAALDGFQHAVGAVLAQGIVAGAQQGEVVVGQPVQEGEVFADVGALAVDQRGVAGQVGMGGCQPRQHRFPVAHRQRALRKGIAQAGDQLLA